MTEEVAIVFNTLTGLAGYPGLKKLMVAPFDMKQRLIGLIERERDHARAGKPARIVAKLNSLVDQEIIEALYDASAAEVTIDLIVRGSVFDRHILAFDIPVLLQTAMKSE